MDGFIPFQHRSPLPMLIPVLLAAEVQQRALFEQLLDPPPATSRRGKRRRGSRQHLPSGSKCCKGVQVASARVMGCSVRAHLLHATRHWMVAALLGCQLAGPSLIGFPTPLQQPSAPGCRLRRQHPLIARAAAAFGMKP